MRELDQRTQGKLNHTYYLDVKTISLQTQVNPLHIFSFHWHDFCHTVAQTLLPASTTAVHEDMFPIVDSKIRQIRCQVKFTEKLLTK